MRGRLRTGRRPTAAYAVVTCRDRYRNTGDHRDGQRIPDASPSPPLASLPRPASPGPTTPEASAEADQVVRRGEADRILTAETLIDGGTPDGRNRASRLLLADGLARHIEILRARSDFVRRLASGPSCYQYQAGPWPVPHGTLVDFRSTPTGFEWLDTFGRRAADQKKRLCRWPETARRTI